MIRVSDGMGQEFGPMTIPSGPTISIPRIGPSSAIREFRTPSGIIRGRLVSTSDFPRGTIVKGFLPSTGRPVMFRAGAPVPVQFILPVSAPAPQPPPPPLPPPPKPAPPMPLPGPTPPPSKITIPGTTITRTVTTRTFVIPPDPRPVPPPPPEPEPEPEITPEEKEAAPDLMIRRAAMDREKSDITVPLIVGGVLAAGLLLFLALGEDK